MRTTPVVLGAAAAIAMCAIATGALTTPSTVISEADRGSILP